MVYDRDLEVLELSFKFQIQDGSYLYCEFDGSAVPAVQAGTFAFPMKRWHFSMPMASN